MYVPEKRTINGITTGDLLTFGRLSQENDDEESPVIWRVLEIGDNEALLIKKKAVMRSRYCDRKAIGNPWYIMWGNSLAREMCNGAFFHKAFTEDEKKSIIPQEIVEAWRGSRCIDEVFLLSEEEVLLLLPEMEQRMASATDELERNAAASGTENYLLRGDYGVGEGNVFW